MPRTEKPMVAKESDTTGWLHHHLQRSGSETVITLRSAAARAQSSSLLFVKMKQAQWEAETERDPGSDQNGLPEMLTNATVS